MRAYFNMPVREFVDQLQDLAIKANARPQVMAMFDDIDLMATVDEVEAEKEKAAQEYDEGVDEARATQHELTSAAVAEKEKTALFGKANKHLKFTPEQVDAIRDALKKAEPES